MKGLKSGVVAVGLLLLFGFSVANADAEYLGEICWSIHITVGDEGPRDETYIQRMKITQLGDNVFNIQGIVEIPGDNPLITQGSATVIGNELFIIQTGSQEHAKSPYQDVGTSQGRVNLLTLSGPFWGISKSYNTSTHQFSDFYSGGTGTLTNCP